MFIEGSYKATPSGNLVSGSTVPASGDSRSGKQGGPAGVNLAERDTMIEATPQCVKLTQQNALILLSTEVWGHAPQEFLKN